MRDTVDEDTACELESVVETLGERPPPHVYQWPQPTHHVTVTPRPLPVRRPRRVVEDYVPDMPTTSTTHHGESSSRVPGADHGEGPSHTPCDEQYRDNEWVSVDELFGDDPSQAVEQMYVDAIDDSTRPPTDEPMTEEQRRVLRTTRRRDYRRAAQFGFSPRS